MLSMLEYVMTSSRRSSSNRNSSNTSSRRPPVDSYDAFSREDRQRALLRITKEGASCKIWKDLPEEWQQDREFILATLNNHEASIPDKCEFERTFSQSLRFDKEIVLAFCRRPDFALKKTDADQDRGLYYERHLFVPGCLCGDKDVMMAYCQKIPRSLQDCSEELCNDRELVLQAITSCGGMELQYASNELQQDIDVLKIACRNHGRALEFSPPLSDARRRLIHDRDFMLDVVLSSPGGGPMWKLLPTQLRQNDDQLVLRALSHGLMLRDVPNQYIRVDFLTRAIRHNCRLYLELNAIKNDPNWQHHPALAREAVISEQSTPDIHALALGPQGCPSLRDHRQVVVAVCHRGSLDMLRELLGQPPNGDDHDPLDNNDDDLFLDAHVRPAPLAPMAARINALAARTARNQVQPLPPPPQQTPFADDMQVMKLAVQRDPAFFSMASPRLQGEPELILASITPESAWNTLTTVPWAIQRQHPEIIIKAIRLCKARNLRYLITHIPEEMWTSHRDIPITWIQRGGRVLEHFERILRGDADMALQLAKYNWAEFYKVGERLLSDRAFMMQALDADGRVLRFAAPGLRDDFDVAVTAFANHYKNIEQGPAMNAAPSASQTYSNVVNLGQIKREIQRRLDLHDTYVKEFLRGIAIKTPHLAPSLRSQLTMLDRGVETSQAFKRLIAEYCGVPVGTKLAMLRKAYENLQRPPNGNASSFTQIPTPWFGAQGQDAEDRRAVRRFRFAARRNRDANAAARNGFDDDDGGDDDNDDRGDVMGGFGRPDPRRTVRMPHQMRRDMIDNRAPRIPGAAARLGAPRPRHVRGDLFGDAGDDYNDTMMVPPDGNGFRYVGDRNQPPAQLGVPPSPPRQQPLRPSILDGSRPPTALHPPAGVFFFPPREGPSMPPPPAAVANNNYNLEPLRAPIFDDTSLPAARHPPADGFFFPPLRPPVFGDPPPPGARHPHDGGFVVPPRAAPRQLDLPFRAPGAVPAAPTPTRDGRESFLSSLGLQRNQQQTRHVSMENAAAPLPPPAAAAAAPSVTDLEERRRQQDAEIEFHRNQFLQSDIRRRPGMEPMSEVGWERHGALHGSGSNMDTRAIQAAERHRESDERLARLEARNARHRELEQEEATRRTFPGFRGNFGVPGVGNGLDDEFNMLDSDDEEDLFFSAFRGNDEQF
jgi:hypothetical protein